MPSEASSNYICPIWHDCFTCPLPQCIADYTKSERPAIAVRAKRIPYMVSVHRYVAQGMALDKAAQAAAAEHGRATRTIYRAMADAVRDGWDLMLGEEA